MENNVLQRQKVVWRRQRGCEIIPIPCIPCVYNGQLLPTDCAKQELSCDIRIDNYQTVLINSVTTAAVNEGYTINDCLLDTLTSKWYVDVRLTGVVLAQDLFYSGYGGTDIPTEQQWITAVDETFDDLQSQGLGYDISGTTINVYSKDCSDDLRGKKLDINVGVNVNIKCEQ